MAGVRDGGGLDDEALQQLRSRATQLLLKEDWREYIAVCSRIVDGAGGDRRVLCSALAHRADARARLHDLRGALADLDAALAADPTHPGALLSKGALLRGLGRYASAAECFRAAGGTRRGSSSSSAGDWRRRRGAGRWICRIGSSRDSPPGSAPTSRSTWARSRCAGPRTAGEGSSR
ncbi:hypothetical protein PR202_gb18708 [Eleusine coracana subsp. coracana]|uniref:Uncharacterized protein n=1 Tax=Eleusine coracana subsp. coracana TaxID=191504 RepID=A0AAV5F419_ELECO|nr:hypothetical protein PR202_gb18708 [Eleusine coracana subsp. coracana]